MPRDFLGYCRWLIRRIIGGAILPILVLLDILNGIFMYFCGCQQSVALFASLIVMICLLLYALRALYEAGPVAAAAADSDRRSFDHLSPGNNVVLEIQISLHFNFFNALVSALKSFLALVCSVGVCVASLATLLLSINPYALAISTLVATMVMQGM